MTLYQHVMDSSVEIDGQEFTEHFTVQGSGTYGNVLFRDHHVRIMNCVFYAGLFIDRAVSVHVFNCKFYGWSNA